MLPVPRLPPVFCFALALVAGALRLRAEQFGPFTYVVRPDNTVEITDFTVNAGPAVNIPALIAGKPVTSIGDSAFADHSITSVTIPSGVTRIGAGAFASTLLTSVSIPATVTTIGASAFSSCDQMQSVTLREGLLSIGDYAFADTDMPAITLPASVSSIGLNPFIDCRWLTSINVAAGNQHFSSRDGVLFDHGVQTLLAYPRERAATDYTVPAGVTRIREEAVFICDKLKRVTLPASLTEIGPSAFALCFELTECALPPGVTVIGSQAFSSCSKLAEMHIPAGVTTINDFSFYSCVALTRVTLPPGLTGIGISAFERCFALSDISIPPSVTYIGMRAFDFCVALRSITIPPGLTSLRERVFHQCAGLTSLTIPPTVTNIQSEAFQGCEGLTSVVIAHGVTRIGGSAFEGCKKLTRVTIPASVTSFDDAFNGCSMLTTVVLAGNAPPVFGPPGWLFQNTAPGLTIFYLAGSTGFTAPNWAHWAPVAIDETVYPAARWLLSHDLEFDTTLHQDADGDGVSLLLAYALDLEPRLNPRAGLPSAVVNGNTLSLTFYAAAPGITYRVETSANLTQWTAAGVAQSGPGPDGRSTASVSRDGPQRFLRLVVEEN